MLPLPLIVSLACTVDTDTPTRSLSRREAILGYAFAPGIGLLFAIAMHASIASLWPMLTLLLAFTLFMLTLVIPLFRLRYHVSSLLILPFCSYIVNNFDVGYGRTYAAPGIAMLLATLLFVGVIVTSIVIKAFFVSWSNADTVSDG